MATFSNGTFDLIENPKWASLLKGPLSICEHVLVEIKDQKVNLLRDIPGMEFRDDPVGVKKILNDFTKLQFVIDLPIPELRRDVRNCYRRRIDDEKGHDHAAFLSMIGKFMTDSFRSLKGGPEK